MTYFAAILVYVQKNEEKCLEKNNVKYTYIINYTHVLDLFKEIITEKRIFFSDIKLTTIKDLTHLSENIYCSENFTYIWMKIFTSEGFA